MNQTAQKLIQCFQVVFPELTPDQIVQADVHSISRWDSVNQIMLLTVVGEEFGIELDLEHLDQFTSYSGILDYLNNILV